MQFSISRATAMAAASLVLACGSAAHAGTFVVLNATGSSSFAASQGSGEGSSGRDTADYTGLGHFDFGNSTAGGFTELLKVPSVEASMSASNTGNAGATMTYEFVFTATHPGEVSDFFQHTAPALLGCAYSPSLPPCVLPPPSPPDYYFANATSITGAWSIGSDGYARGTVSASAYGPPDDNGRFEIDCGYASSSGCGRDDFHTGTFSIVGALMANAASIDANSFYGFMTLSAHGAVFEGGDFDAFIDPQITFDLPGLDPKDFTLTISPNLTSGGGVPEPGAWALMLLGFGGIGASLRRRRLVAA